MTPETLAALREAREQRRAVVLATRLTDGVQHLVPGPAAPDALFAPAAEAIDADAGQTVEIDGETWFLHPYAPPRRLVIVGAVHIAQALAPLAARLGYGVVVVDPRGAFATEERFPGVEVSQDWPDEALDELQPDRRTAVITLTHDPKLDDPALHRALQSDAFYLGALGSKRTHAKRLERLRELGHDDAALGRIRGPIGLPLGAVTAPEIAVSILAELVAARRGAAIAQRNA